jgi:putative peptidoglycan lipid II flippase
MASLSNSISLVSGLTIVSRVLGLLRDVLFFACFGVSAIGDAFILAFTIPNLFRRMLGEGTLSSAFIPVYSEIKEKYSLRKAQDVLNQVLSRLFVFLFVLSIAVCLISWIASQYNWIDSQKWVNGLFLNTIIFPYVLLICISAIIVGALNTHKSFFAGAFSPIILNLAMISGLAIFYLGMSWRGLNLGIALCFAVLVGGGLQAIWPWFQLRRDFEWRWRFNFSSSAGLEKIKKLFLIGAFSAAVSQVNIMISRFLAYNLEDEGALSYLFLSARLIELPLGVFAISISTVFFPELSQAFSKEKKSEYKNFFARGFRLTMGMILPASIGLALLSDSILSVLFQWGEFGQEDVWLASEVLVVSCFALPFYALAAYLIKAFHSQKNMTPPLHAAIISLCVNFILSIILMQEYGMIGLAWANVISAFLQTTFLAIKLNDFELKSIFSESIFSFFSIIISSAVMFGVLWLVNQQEYFSSSKESSIVALLILIPLGVLIYGISLIFCGFPELEKFRPKMVSQFFKTK